MGKSKRVLTSMFIIKRAYMYIIVIEQSVWCMISLFIEEVCLFILPSCELLQISLFGIFFYYIQVFFPVYSKANGYIGCMNIITSLLS